MNGTSLLILGLTATEERIYRHFLRNPGTLGEDIHVLLHSPREEVESAQERLIGLGLLHSDQAALFATDPETAVGRLTDLQLRVLHEQLQQVTQSRHLIADLKAEQGAKSLAPQGVERLAVLSQIRDRIDDLAFFAREEILSVEPYSALTAENIVHARPLDTRCLRRGVRIRSVVRKEALDHPPTVAYLRELTAQGASIRVAESFSERILVYDRQTALVPVDPEDTSRGALVTQQAGLVANILALFQKIWDQAVDLSVLTDDGSEAAGVLSEIERRVLEELCRVGKDETGARNLDISVRTYRRHVADVLRILGASSRPHAALLAREKGWI
ncbi:helix-turn-helix transcriptional regulator [Streptomyces sp. NBC_00249]|uniref:helix-turn-helix transcriptional regulator n=1 Tax=Streptomyces sp. NBC_00249 TaxID=2975690 RepID=UPI00224FE1EB|nr:helix-turn-helix transcriptional regulator [Streptomyces sp. NBC_00249]MCX5195977.1 helix-turn-helix transcriptional regulator [Streptomyces sp. NBC_00249]